MCFPPSLTNIPPEILDEIAFHTVLIPKASKLGPPCDLHSLLLTCKAVHESLSTSCALLARIFRCQFDYAALARRFSPSWLTSNVLADQLKTRWTILKRIRSVGVSWEQQGDLKDSWPIDSWGKTNVTEDLWMAFLMLLESDGKNVQQLRNAKMQSYLDAYVNVFLIRRAKQYDYQNETVNSTLAIWIGYLLEDEATIAKESISQVETYTGLIRPFVFGAHRYDSYFAPWSIFELPVTVPPEQQTNGSDSPGPSGNNHRLPNRYRDRQFRHYMASDLDLQNNSQPVTCLSRQLLMCAPIMTLAAINSYFTRVDYHFRMRPAMAAAAAAGHHPTNTGAGPAPAVMPSGPAVVAPRIGTDVNYYATTDDSTIYDGDFRRLTSCLNPYIRSLPPGESFYPPGTFAGVWEGRFTFLEFDQYRDMLVGYKLPPIVKVDELLGGQQPQVWKVNEYHLTRAATEAYRKRAESESTAMRSSPEASSSSSRMSPLMRSRRSPVDTTAIEPLPIGHALNAHLPVGCRFVEVPGGLEVHEAGKPGCLFYKQSSRLSEMSSPSMSNGSLNNGLGSENHHNHNSNSNHSTTDSPEHEDDERILDTLITGSGHSAWGPFTLRGRVRQWDGLVTVLKDYSGSDGIDPADSSGASPPQNVDFI
ncbi:hypothetical protein FRC04_005156 [Tulasnella sp. 424]|nr:hypothetical protein FRC04_005156 [Tulasnella sp. 424]KAG8972215.1 hypothetical protein FRC05_010264 [Tulasnella sp. 425]